MISFIIPYQHNPTRDTLLYVCLDSFAILNKKEEIEVCIHETGTKPTLPKSLSEYGYKYLFSQWNWEFHRAWTHNRGVKYLSTGDSLVLLDGDLIITQEWLDAVIMCNSVAYGWNYMNYLTKENTKQYFNTKKIIHTGVTVTPSELGMAGGATIIPREIFYSVKGIPEIFRDTWGCEDNAFILKLIALGYHINTLPSQLYHMYHDRIEIGKYGRSLISIMQSWGLSEWKQHVSSVLNWGEPALPPQLPIHKQHKNK